MDELYEPLHKKAVSLQYQFHDSINDPNHPMVHVLAGEIHQLTQDIESKRHPRSIEDRIKVIEHQLVQARAQGDEVLNYQHNEDLSHRYEFLRHDVTKLPHY